MKLFWGHRESFSIDEDFTTLFPSIVYTYTYGRLNGSGNSSSKRLSIIPGIGIISYGTGSSVDDAGSGGDLTNMLSFNGARIIDDSLNIDELLEYLD